MDVAVGLGGLFERKRLTDDGFHLPCGVHLEDFFELPADFYDTYQERIRSVGADQVEAMAARYFAGCASRTLCRDGAADLQLVLVGNVSQFREALKKQFPSAQYEEIPFDQIDLLSADLRRPKELPPAPRPQ